jgi:hypothetical protein
MSGADSGWAFGLAAVTVVLFVIAWIFDAISIIYDIHLSEKGIAFVLFRVVTVYNLRFPDIECVKETRGGYFQFRAYNFKNRFFARTFLIQKKRGWVTRKILVTPRDPYVFVSYLVQAGVTVIHGDTNSR